MNRDNPTLLINNFKEPFYNNESETRRKPLLFYSAEFDVGTRATKTESL